MASHVALLRGINVGGQQKVAMADLREIVQSLGHTDVTTYIQSGNIIFTATGTGSELDVLAGQIEAAIAATLGLRPRVVVLTCDELAEVVTVNPFAHEPNPKAVHAIFLSHAPDEVLTEGMAAAQRQAAAKGSRDSAQVLGRTVFLHTPDGYGRSDLAGRLARITDKHPRTTATARNWATVTRLLSLCGS